MDDAKWHWAEGMKFALEGVKLLFILNGAASVSILTFIGNMKVGSASLVWAMSAFAIGALTTVPAMVFAYLAQLYYGNASQDETCHVSIWNQAGSLHHCAYVFIGLGLLFFLTGVGFAAHGLLHSLGAN
jgi:hypothetical protein